MGLLPQLLLGALIVAAFAFTAQQRLAIASHTGPAPARQIAYLMRTYHQSSVAYKIANPAALGVIAEPPPSMTGSSQAAFLFTSCAGAHSVVTTLGGVSATPGAGASTAYLNQSIAQELSRQTVIPPELGQVASSPAVTGYGGETAPQLAFVPGIGLSDGSEIQGGAGPVALPGSCAVAAGLPAIQTRAVP